LRELGEAYVSALLEHRGILREAFARHDGIEVSTKGDSFFVVFQSASDAVAAAIESQAGLRSGPVWVRMGLHTGEPFLSDDDYVGLDVHLAARITEAAHGGQVVISATTRELLAVDTPLRDLGRHPLKDFEEPVQLFQFGDERFPPLRVFPKRPFPGRVRHLQAASARFPKS
jgi:class 3 adenylate cyclase